jgi:ATP/maltotriose-dependent transcriptional regulator MalT
LERAGFDAALATFESVSRQTAILRERVPGVYDCHPVFQEFLVSRTRRSGAIAARALHVQAARALESAFCLGPALEAYTLAGSTLDVLRIIETHGFELVDRGLIDPLVKGIALLDPAAKRSNPRIVALRGVIYSFAGKRPRAESLLKRALDLAKSDEELFAKISITLAMILTNKGEGIATLLEPVLENRALSYACRAEALSLLAAQRSLVGDAESARKAIAEIDSILSNVDIDIPRAKVLQRLGVAYIYIGEATQAKETLLEAADIALGLQLMSLASRAYTNLSNLMLYEFDDVRMQLAYARKGLEAANAARNPFDIQTALLQIIAAETRSGNGEASEHAEAELARHLEGDESRLHYLATSKALRAAWKGDFGSAHRLISPCWWRLHNKLDQLTIGAHCALFLAVDAKREASVVLITKLLMLASPVRDDSRCIARAKAVCLMFCAIAETLNGRNGRSQRIIAELKSDADEVIKIASSVADEIIPMLQPKYSGFRKPTVSARLEELSTLGYGFVPRTLGALLEHIASDSSRIEGNPLTASELSTLRMLDRGLATKEIALRKKCSIYTVRAHIANAIGKLHCRGRAEALATARGLGFLD